MKPFIRKKLPLILIVAQAVLILGILLYIVPGRYRLYDIVLYDASENVPSNPLVGYAPRAENLEDCAGTELVFLMLPFSEWEPREGYFDIEGVEQKYHLRQYRAAGKHAVLRFVCDLPGQEAHRDIPDWLYERAGKGTAYEDASGRGYAPDYSDEAFLSAHKEAVRALADWCGKDSFVSYVEIGSIGREGDWSSLTDSSAGPHPSRETLLEYARQYQEAFAGDGDIRLLGSGDTDLLPAGGSWRDCLGDGEACALWDLEAVRKDTEEENSLSKNEAGKDSETDDAAKEGGRIWTQSPVAGGMASSLPMGELLNDSLSNTLEQIRKGHISFIGPSCPDAAMQKTNGSGMILRNVGYCIYLSRLQTTVDFIDDALLFHLTFSNIGQTPMYWDWPVKMYLYDSRNQLVSEQTLDLSLSGLMPDTEITVTGKVPYSKELLKGYKVGISITNPEGTEFITLAQKGVLPDREGIHKVYRYKIR